MATNKIITTGKLAAVKFDRSTGKYQFTLEECSPGNTAYRFNLSRKKALQITNGDEQFPLSSWVKVSGCVFSYLRESLLGYVKILSVDGVEVHAWSQRVGSVTVDPDVLSAAERRVKAALESEESMVNRAPPVQPGIISDPLEAYDNAMRIVRRQRRLKNPKLSKQEIWHVRDALNLMAEKLGII